MLENRIAFIILLILTMYVLLTLHEASVNNIYAETIDEPDGVTSAVSYVEPVVEPEPIQVVEPVVQYEEVSTWVYSQEMSLFQADNLTYRGNSSVYSLGGEYHSYSGENIMFVGDVIRQAYDIHAGDIIELNGIDYTVIDNKSNCNNFTSEYCVEILRETNATTVDTIKLKE